MTELLHKSHPWYGSASANEASSNADVLEQEEEIRPLNNNNTSAAAPPHSHQIKKSNGSFRRRVSTIVIAGCLTWVTLTVAWHYHLVLLSPWLATRSELELATFHYPGSNPLEIRRAQAEANAAARVLQQIMNHNDEDNEEEPSIEQQQPQPQQHRYLKKKSQKERLVQQVVHAHSKHHKHSNADKETNKAQHVQEGCESTVLILRHCEKGSIKEHCAYQGFERSVYLASLFGDTTESRWPLPTAIFAQAPVARENQHKMNFREVETVGPLALLAGVKVDDSYTDDTLHELGRDILRATAAGHLCGQTVVVVWKHSRIAHLARALGCGPEQGCPVDYSGHSFDAVWQVRSVYRHWPHSSSKRFVKSIRKERPEWKVFGSVQYQQFDPLAVSKQFGDYPPGGTPASGNWQALQVEYPERQKNSDTAGWQMKHVGLPRTGPAEEATTEMMSDNGDKPESKHNEHHHDNR